MTVPLASDADTANPLGDEALRVIVRGTDREAEFTAFMTSASPALARTAWLLCGDTHQAEELVQQALTRTYLAWGTARERDPLAYARPTLANLRVDTWRRRRREVLVDPNDVPERAQDSDADRLAERDRLLRALATLSPRQRRIVVLRHFDGRSEREVAEDLGVSVGTVKSTASRSLARLRELLDDGTGPGRPLAARPATTTTAATKGQN